MMRKPNITVMILTFNEELHIGRCLQSVSQLTNKIVVVDCFSTDKTVAIAKQFGVTFLQRAWENSHSTQVNWALSQLPANTQWVMRIDADEVLPVSCNTMDVFSIGTPSRSHAAEMIRVFA